jgi:hypothetical protein
MNLDLVTNLNLITNLDLDTTPPLSRSLLAPVRSTIFHPPRQIGSRIVAKSTRSGEPVLHR